MVAYEGITLENFADWVETGWTRKNDAPADAVRELAVMTLGLSGEVDEVIAEIRKSTGGVTELIKKEIRGDGPLDRQKLKLELGDVLHYLCRIAKHYEIDVGEVMRSNIAKIEARRGPANGSLKISKGKYYLAGPMSGYPQFNFPLFISAAADLRARGYEIISPAELDAENGIDKQAMESTDGDASKLTQTWGDLLSRDVKIVADQVNGLILLPGWDKSRGARLEAFVGVLSGHKFYEYSEREENTSEDFLLELHPILVLNDIAIATAVSYGK